MTILTFLLYVVIFFSVSTLIQLLYNFIMSKYHLQMDWLIVLMPIITIIIWMIVPTHWVVLISFAITTGLIVGEKDNKKITKRKLY